MLLNDISRVKQLTSSVHHDIIIVNGLFVSTQSASVNVIINTLVTLLNQVILFFELI